MAKRANGTTAKTVLIVEDHHLNMKLFTDLLEAHGHRVLQARDGAEGMMLARQHHPDLILMDIRLPGISGFEVTKWIREEQGLRYTPIVALTAFAMRDDEEKIREAGYDAYMSKPISVRNFLALVDRFLV
jgi:two-component system, cell cycle response regulator DivK